MLRQHRKRKDGKGNKTEKLQAHHGLVILVMYAPQHYHTKLNEFQGFGELCKCHRTMNAYQGVVVAVVVTAIYNQWNSHNQLQSQHIEKMPAIEDEQGRACAFFIVLSRYISYASCTP